MLLREILLKCFVAFICAYPCTSTRNSGQEAGRRTGKVVRLGAACRSNGRCEYQEKYDIANGKATPPRPMHSMCTAQLASCVPLDQSSAALQGDLCHAPIAGLLSVLSMCRNSPVARESPAAAAVLGSTNKLALGCLACRLSIVLFQSTVHAVGARTGPC